MGRDSSDVYLTANCHILANSQDVKSVLGICLEQGCIQAGSHMFFPKDDQLGIYVENARRERGRASEGAGRGAFCLGRG